MKKTLMILVAVLCMVAPVLGSNSANSGSARIAMTVLVDTSWSCGDDMADFRTLARQAAAGLRANDYIEILTAHAGRPRIRLAQTIRSGSPSEIAAIAAILAGIRDDGLFSDAQVSAALEMALHRLDSARTKPGYPQAIVLVLTDGHFSDSDAGRVLELAEEFQKRNWPFYITGDRGTHRSLLIAASKKKITWSSIMEANPGLWLQQLRESIQQRSEELLPKAPADGTKAHTGPQTPSVTQGELSPVAGAPPQDDIKARWKTELDVTVSGGALPRSAGKENEPSSRIQEQEAAVISVEPNRQTEITAAPPAGEQETTERPRLSWWARTKRFIGPLWPWLVAASILPCVAMGYVLLQGHRQAREWTLKRKSQLTDRNLDDGIVIAKVNGQTYHLGQRGQFATVHIGSGVNTTIRTPEAGISDRHVRLYRRGTDLMVRNIGARPITVNSLPLAPRAKQRLVLPSVVELTENTKLTLSLLRPKEPVAAGRSEDHEQSRQQ
jgi:hypothetical protein